MTLKEFSIEMIDFEELYKNRLDGKQVQIWYARFNNWTLKEFQRIKELVIKKIYRFPTIADFFILRQECPLSVENPNLDYLNQPFDPEQQAKVADLIHNTAKGMRSEGEADI